jgi:hypothetical protein
MKKVILLYVIMLFLSVGAFAQAIDTNLRHLELKPGITLVLKRIPPTLGLVVPQGGSESYTVTFHGAQELTLATTVDKDDAKHLQLKPNDFDGSKLILSFAGGKLTAIGKRQLETPVEIPLVGHLFEMSVN